MKISGEELLKNGFQEHKCAFGTFYTKEHLALIYNYNVWIPCYYDMGTILADKIYVETMEEIDLLSKDIL